jgi:hypothetical protein
MSDSVLPKKHCRLLLASAALNIFLIAFMLGRCGMVHDHHGPHEEHGEMRSGSMMPPPPRFFSPEDLFTPEEMKQDAPMFHANFEAMKKMRSEFAAKLKQGSVTKEEVLAHFAERDKMMGETKKKLQEKAANKIASLTPEAREKFASEVLEENDKGPHGEHHEYKDGPGDDHK